MLTPFTGGGVFVDLSCMRNFDISDFAGRLECREASPSKRDSAGQVDAAPGSVEQTVQDQRSANKELNDAYNDTVTHRKFDDVIAADLKAAFEKSSRQKALTA